MDLPAYLLQRKSVIDASLEKYLPPADAYPPPLSEAMRYSVFAGGKRLRPILCLAGCEAVSGLYDEAIPAACALELIHTYSLIHDDLPAMDDDTIRRGKPTSHKVYGEAVAMLAGDALLTEAFAILARGYLHKDADHHIALRVIEEIASASGVRGMVAGQVMDIRKQGQPCTGDELDFIHRHKTARLIMASVSSGAMLGQAEQEELSSYQKYGLCIGLCFQIVDDILDVEGDASLGKERGRDEKLHKATYPSLHGMEAAKSRAAELSEQAVASLSRFDSRSEPLRAIAEYIVRRKI